MRRLKAYLIVSLLSGLSWSCQQQEKRDSKGLGDGFLQRTAAFLGITPECSPSRPCIPPNQTPSGAEGSPQDPGDPSEVEAPTPPAGNTPGIGKTSPGICSVPKPDYEFRGCTGVERIPWQKRMVDADLMQADYEELVREQGLPKAKVEVAVLDSGYEYFQQDAPDQLLLSPYANAIKGVEFATGSIVRDNRNQVAAEIEIEFDSPASIPPLRRTGETVTNGFFDIDSLHGTHVNGMIAGCDGYGIAKNIRLTSFRFDLGDVCSPRSEDLIAAIDAICQRPSRLAEAEKFKVINVSLGSLTDELDYDSKGAAMTRFQQKIPEWLMNGCIIVQASGNDGHIRRYNMTEDLYQAMKLKNRASQSLLERIKAPYYMPKVANDQYPSEKILNDGYKEGLADSYLEVGATGLETLYADFSSWGEVKAPGSNVEIFTSFHSGTSFSAPLTSALVAEIAATIKTFNRTYWDQLSPEQRINLVLNILKKSDQHGIPNGLRSFHMARAIAKDLSLSSTDWADARMQLEICPNKLKERASVCSAQLENFVKGGDYRSLGPIRSCFDDSRRILSLCKADSLSYLDQLQLIDPMLNIAINRDEIDSALLWLDELSGALIESGVGPERVSAEYAKRYETIKQVWSTVNKQAERTPRTELINIRLTLLRHLALSSSAVTLSDLTLWLGEFLDSQDYLVEMQKRSNRGSEEKMSYLIDLLSAFVQDSRLSPAVISAIEKHIDSQIQKTSAEWLKSPLNYEFIPLIRLLDQLNAQGLFPTDLARLEKDLMDQIDGLATSRKSQDYWKPLAQSKPAVEDLKAGDWVEGLIPADDKFYLDLSYIKNAARRFVDRNGLPTLPILQLGWLASYAGKLPQTVGASQLLQTKRYLSFSTLTNKQYKDLLKTVENIDLNPNSPEILNYFDTIDKGLILGTQLSTIDKASCLNPVNPRGVQMTVDEKGYSLAFDIPCLLKRQEHSGYDLLVRAARRHRFCIAPAQAPEFRLVASATGIDRDLLSCPVNPLPESALSLLEDIDSKKVLDAFDQELLDLLGNLKAAGSISEKNGFYNKVFNATGPSKTRLLASALDSFHDTPRSQEDATEQDKLERSLATQLAKIMAQDGDLKYASRGYETRRNIGSLVRYFGGFKQRNQLIPNDTLWIRNDMLMGLMHLQDNLIENEDEVEPIDLALSYELLRQSEVCKQFGPNAFNRAWASFPLYLSRRDSYYLPLIKTIMTGGDAFITGDYRLTYELSRVFAKNCWGETPRDNVPQDRLLCKEGSSVADVMFVIDRSGSMQEQIDNVKFWTREIAQQLYLRQCSARFGALTYEAQVDANILFPTADQDEFALYMSGVVAQGGLEYGIDAVRTAFDILQDSQASSSEKFVVLISDEINLTREVPSQSSANEAQSSEDTTPLAQYWMQTDPDSHFVYAIDESVRDQFKNFADKLAPGRTLQLSYPLNNEDFINNLSSFIVNRLNSVPTTP